MDIFTKSLNLLENNFFKPDLINIYAPAWKSAKKVF
jgi:hypothetical protein